MSAAILPIPSWHLNEIRPQVRTSCTYTKPGKRLEVLKAVVGVVVAVTNSEIASMPFCEVEKNREAQEKKRGLSFLARSIICVFDFYNDPFAIVRSMSATASRLRLATLAFSVLASMMVCHSGYGAVLPEDRADLLYHSYDGGGVTIDGPSVLVRKGFNDKVSVSANFYQDVISSASIDVLATGSKYSEERNEYSVGIDYLINKATVSVGFGNSTEDDYIADSYSFGISQDFFGDMTTLTMGYSYGDNIVRRNEELAAGEEPFEETAKQQRFRLGITQILTKSWIVAFSAESIIDAGYLNNPYRQVRYRDGDGVGYQSEVYPQTRNSDALAIRSSYYLPYRAALRFEARAFHDSWGINAQNYELRYTHPMRDKLILEFKVRTYTQSEARFYADLFPHYNAQEFMARDKELSEFSSNELGIGLTYYFDKKLPFAERQNLSLFWDFIQYDYDNFRNQLLSSSEGEEPAQYRLGEEPTYGFEANVIRLFFTVLY